VLTAQLPTAEAGVSWDAVRIPFNRGLDLHRRLSLHEDVRGRLGPVVASERSQQTYWLITTGTTPEAWPPGCRLLTTGSTIVLPHTLVPADWSRWVHRPSSPDHLTGAVWLAAALTHPALEAHP
jgi:hypothetical protein